MPACDSHRGGLNVPEQLEPVVARTDIAPLISVLVVTWNRKADVLATVESIRRQPYSPIETIVVDNGSTDGTVEALRTCPEVRLVALDRNLGAAGGRNLGIEAARGDIIFLLDSDASLEADTLAAVERRFAAEPALGIIGCRIINAVTGELDGWIYPEEDKDSADREFASYSFCSAGAAIRRVVFERAGLFWADLFIYREEDDFSLRAWDAGYRVIYFPGAEVRHRASPQTRVTPGRREYYDLRNSLFIYLVRYPWWLLVWIAPLKIAAAGVKGARKRCLSQVLRALLTVLRRLPHLLRQRRPIAAATARAYLVLQREHGPLHWDWRSWFTYKAKR